MWNLKIKHCVGQKTAIRGAINSFFLGYNMDLVFGTVSPLVLGDIRHENVRLAPSQYFKNKGINVDNFY